MHIFLALCCLQEPIPKKAKIVRFGAIEQREDLLSSAVWRKLAAHLRHPEQTERCFHCSAFPLASFFHASCLSIEPSLTHTDNKPPEECGLFSNGALATLKPPPNVIPLRGDYLFACLLTEWLTSLICGPLNWYLYHRWHRHNLQQSRRFAIYPVTVLNKQPGGQIQLCVAHAMQWTQLETKNPDTCVLPSRLPINGKLWQQQEQE